MDEDEMGQAMSDRSPGHKPSGVGARGRLRTGVAEKAATIRPGAPELPSVVLEAARQTRDRDSAADPEAALAAMLAQPDPGATLMKRTRGGLGRRHKLNY